MYVSNVHLYLGLWAILISLLHLCQESEATEESYEFQIFKDNLPCLLEIENSLQVKLVYASRLISPHRNAELSSYVVLDSMKYTEVSSRYHVCYLPATKDNDCSPGRILYIENITFISFKTWEVEEKLKGMWNASK